MEILPSKTRRRKERPHVRVRGCALDVRWNAEDGIRRRKRVEYRSPAAAAKAEKEVAGRLENGLEPFQQAKEPAWTVSETLAFYLEQHGPDMKARSLERAKEHKRALAERLGGLRVETITFDALARYRRERMNDPSRPKAKEFKGTVGEVTVKKEVAFARAACRYALSVGRIASHPFNSLTREQRRLLFPREESRGRSLDAAEFEQILAKVRPHYRNALRFARLSGLRKGELCSITWEGIRGDVLMIGEAESKTGARRVPLTQEMRALLPPRPIRGGLIFTSPRGGRLYNALNSAWRDARAEAGSDARLHDLRHSTATALLDLVDAGAVGEVLGMSPATIKTYDHARFERARAAFEKMHSKTGANGAEGKDEARKTR